MKTSNYSQASKYQTRYRNRQDLAKILMQEKIPLEERQTHLAIFDVLDEIRQNRKQLLRENKWDAYLIGVIKDGTPNGIEINGRHSQEIRDSYSIHTKEGKEQLKSYIGENLAIIIEAYSGKIKGIKKKIKIEADDEAVKQGLIRTQREFTSQMCGCDIPARLEERMYFDQEINEVNPDYIPEKKDVIGLRHEAAWASSFYFPTWASSKDAGGIATLFMYGKPKFSHLASEPVPYTPSRQFAPPLEKKITQYAHA